MIKCWMAAAAAVAVLSGVAQADDHALEVRFGVTAHDLADHVEDGPNYTVEALFPAPGFLDVLWSPRSYVYGSFNANGLTNFGATGLAWDFDLADNLRFEFKTGLSYHDGVEDIDPNSPADDPTRIRLATTRSLMGSRVLFHNSLGMDLDVAENWSVGAYYEHISHGQILASGRNQALDNAGVRVSYRFGH